MAVAQDSLYLRLQTMSSSLDGRPASALARGVQITEFSESRVNPEPIVLEDSDLLLEQYLSPGKLRLLTGIQDLESVKCLEIKVDTSDTSLGNFGSLLPNLTQLKLSNSHIRCIRDLGSSLRNITVLWMSRCGLTELDGVSSMLAIKELYLSYNEVCDISPLGMLDCLQILDLEGNNIDDEQQIHHLTMCMKLRSLTLEGNPVCVLPRPDADVMEEYDYRLSVKKAIPHLKYLDEELLTDEASPTKKCNVFDDDWAYLEELQKDVGIGGSMESIESSQDSGSRPGTGRPGTASLRPSTGYRPGAVLRPGTGFRPMSASRRPATTSGANVRPATVAIRPGTASQKANSEAAAMTDDSSSELTMGRVICGNPSKALIARRKIRPDPEEKESTELKLFPQFQHKPEHTYDPLPEDSREKSEIFNELKEWKAEHEKRMEKIRAEQAPQVLVVDHDDAVSISSSEEMLTDDEDDQFRQDFSPLDSSKDDELSLAEMVLRAEKRNQFKDLPSSSDIYEGLNLTKIHRGLKHDESFDLDRDLSDIRGSPDSKGSPKPIDTDGPLNPLKPLQPIKSAGHDSSNFSREVIVPLPGRQSPSYAMEIPRAPPSSAISRSPLSRSMIHDTKTGLPLPDRSSPLLRQSIATDRSIPPTSRPSTASAVLSHVPQPRIRRQLPSVPSLPSKPSFPK